MFRGKPLSGEHAFICVPCANIGTAVGSGTISIYISLKTIRFFASISVNKNTALIYVINSANLAIIRKTIEHAMEFSIWAITYRLSLFGWIGIKHMLITLQLNLIVCLVLWEISNILIATINIHWFIVPTSHSLLNREIEIPSVSVRHIEPIMRCHVITIREMCTLFANWLEIMLRYFSFFFTVYTTVNGCKYVLNLDTKNLKIINMRWKNT